MATETSVETYTGVHGSVLYGGVAFAECVFDADFPRDAVYVPRSGKYSDLSLPGKVKPKVKIKYGLVDGDLFVNAFDDGTNTTTTSDEALHAGIAGTGVEQLINTALSNPSTPMTIKLKIVSTDGFSAGGVLIEGTDANDNLISETITFATVATGSTTNYYYGAQKFKTITGIIVPAVLSANDTLTVYGAGQKTVTLGAPKLVTIVGKVMKGAKYFQITMANCWLSNLPFSFSDASTAVLPEQNVEVRDPDSDITITESTV